MTQRRLSTIFDLIRGIQINMHRAGVLGVPLHTPGMGDLFILVPRTCQHMLGELAANDEPPRLKPV